VYKGIPLKKVGFQRYSGANPHFKKIQNSIIKVTRPKDSTSLKEFTDIKKEKIYSVT
jgi:hypothetical protein